MRCDLCDFETDNRERYAGHRSAHVRRGDLPKKAPPSPDHVCKICGRQFDTGPQLGAHSRAHWSPEKLMQNLRYGGRAVSLRKALLHLGRKYECEVCQQGPTWNGQPLTLQVDHKDGDNQNHVPENLRFLCPNCHTQTPTYCGKKRMPG